MEGIFKSAVISAPIEKIWELWTTEAGLNSFFAHHSVAEIEKGGRFEIYFDPKDEQRSTKGSKCLCAVPMRMLSFEWSGGPFSESMNQKPLPTYVVLLFDEITANSTRVELFHEGFGDDGDFHKGVEYFTNAWDEVLGDLKEAAEM